MGQLAEKGLYVAGCFHLLPFSEKNCNSKFQVIFSTAVLLSRYVCSHNKKNGLFNYQIQTAELFDIDNILFLDDFLTIFFVKFS